MFTRVSGPQDLSKFDLFYTLSDDAKKERLARSMIGSGAYSFEDKDELILKQINSLLAGLKSYSLAAEPNTSNFATL
jgi:hypothetical protein